MIVALLKISYLLDSRTYRKHYRWAQLYILIAVMVAVPAPLAHATQQDFLQSQTAEVKALMARVGPPSHLAIKEFKKAGMEGIRPHTMTASERTKVEAVLASLPRLNSRVLEKRLHHLAFVDGIPGTGTGLTSPDAKTGLYDITLRASILDEPLSTFLTNKERRVFSDDGSALTVTVTGTGTDALTYVLLHESTHIVDKTCGITADPRSRFTTNIWAAQKTLVSQFSSSAAATTIFRGGHALAVRQAATVYSALSQTPFVSLYSTASDMEDLAELVAWREVLLQHQGNLIIKVNDASGKTVSQWEPLTFPGVQKRFADVDELLGSPATCRDVV